MNGILGELRKSDETIRASGSWALGYNEALDDVRKRLQVATTRTEYMLEGLAVKRDDPDENATWEPWGTFGTLDDPFAQDRLAFLKDRKEAALGGGPLQAHIRILDYRILRREVITTEWEDVT